MGQPVKSHGTATRRPYRVDMHVEIRGRGRSVTPTLKAHAERQLQFSLSRFANRIKRVTVRLDDLETGDTRCDMSVTLDRGEALSVEDQSTDLLLVVDHTASRLGRLVARELERQRQTNRAPRLGSAR